LVVLGGDGGDELFGGYERYRLSRISSYYNLLPNFIRKFGNKFDVLRKLNSKKGIEQFKLYMFQKDDVLSRIIRDVRKNSDLVEDYFNNHIIRCFDRYDGPDILMKADQQSWLVDESLMRSDKMSMAGGVEMRVPLLDLDLESYSRKIPMKFKVGVFKGKKILRYAMRKSIPNYILKAPKRGWFSPGAKWLRDKDVVNLVEEVLTEKYYNETCELFDFKELMSLFCDHKNKKGYHYNIIWSVLFFQMWAKKFQVKLK
jgi:asparagine synthase (glutamine-hydrolysing)